MDTLLIELRKKEGAYRNAMKFHHVILPACLLVVLVVLLAGCESQGSGASGAASSPPPLNAPLPLAASPTARVAMPDGAVVAIPPTPAEGASDGELSSNGEMMLALESSLIDRKPSALSAGDPAPDFSYTLEDGTTHQLSDLQGKKVLVNFWATWCPPCKAEMPDIQEAAETFREEGFRVLAVSQDPEPQRIAPFARSLQLTFPVIADPESEIARRYGVRGLPSSFFINTDGTIHSSVMGMVSVNSIERHLSAME